MKLKDWLANAKSRIDSLDAELIAVKALDFSDRTDLILYSEDEFEFDKAEEMIKKREGGLPLAYILGYKEFYGREFSVNQNVLIPRPETEEIIVSVLGIVDVEAMNQIKILDVGCGSGCIPITLKLELSLEGIRSEVMGVDVSEPALKTSKENAEKLGAMVEFKKSDLLSKINDLPDIMTANLPYVDLSWDWTSESLKFEPALALYADDGGLKLIKKLIDQIVTKKIDNRKRFLVLEADTSQHEKIIGYGKTRGFSLINHSGFILRLPAFPILIPLTSVMMSFFLSPAFSPAPPEMIELFSLRYAPAFTGRSYSSATAGVIET